MLGEIAVSIMSLSLIILPVVGYFAIKNNWSIFE
jgi:hypothetical protein